MLDSVASTTAREVTPNLPPLTAPTHAANTEPQHDTPLSADGDPHPHPGRLTPPHHRTSWLSLHRRAVFTLQWQFILEIYTSNII